MTGHSLEMVTAKLTLHPDLIVGLTCSVGLIRHFPCDPVATLLIAVDVDLSEPQSKSWQLHRLLTGKEADRD